MTFKVTVLQVIPALDSGGAERTTVEIAGAIVASGGRALVATSGGALVADVERAGGEVFPMPVDSKNPAVIAANAARLRRLAAREGADIIHVRSRAPAWSALRAARAAGLPLVATYHGAYRAAGPLKRLYNSAMVRGDLVIANSEFTARAIRAGYRIDRARLVVIPRGADLDRFDPAKVSTARVAAATAAWRLGGGRPFRVLLPARLTSWKGHETTIDAVALLASSAKLTRAGTGQTPVLQVVFAGGAQGRDDFRANLQRRVEERGVRDMIHLVGHCADMPAAMAWADAILSPSTRPEAFGRVAVEAGAMRKPVIASDHGGARETVVDGETGVLVPPADAVALKEALEWLMESPDRREQLGAAARQRVEREFSTAAMCAQTLDAYRGVLARRTH